MQSTIRDNLIANVEAEYGAEYKSHCLEIYKLYVEKADAISARRQTANSFFLTLNTTILGISGYLITSDTGAKLLLGVAGVLLCIFWFRLIRSYKQLNSAKFKVIHEMEKELPFSPYDAEWILIDSRQGRKSYLPFTTIEMAVPLVFFAFHGFTLIASYPKICFAIGGLSI